MNVCVYGLWHLGAVTAACLASRDIATIGLAETAADAKALNDGVPPLFEPGLEDLMKQGLSQGRLRFTDDPAAAVASADLVWVAFDTPVDDNDVADVAHVLDRVRRIFPMLKDGAVVLVSSQLPVGSIAGLEKDFAAAAAGRTVSFACSPENLRLGDAIRVFTEPERIVVGIRDDHARRVIEPILRPFCNTLLWVRVESAEMVKHALNSYLATCITFTNEVATICENVSADMSEVEAALRLDPRVGQKAYVRAGAAFGGGTLARDVQFLNQVARAGGHQVPVLAAVLESNNQHKRWVIRHLGQHLKPLAGRQIGILGLAYKAGTDAIRRSVAIELIQDLLAAGARVVAFDPKVEALPSAFAEVAVLRSATEVFVGSEAVIVATEWPQFRDLDFAASVATMRYKLLIDQNGFVGKTMAAVNGVDYIVAGRGA